MRQPLRRARIVALLSTLPALLALAAAGASAHVTEESGPLRVEIGWGDEPPLAGQGNSVEVSVSDSTGAPVAVPAGALSAEVSYGGEAITLPLTPDGRPGGLSDEIVPTRPGTYAFHVTGTARGRTLDVSATCSEATFDCVAESSDLEFPVDDPSTGELSRRLSRESARLEEAKDDAGSARTIAIAALAIAAVALAASLGRGLAGRRQSG